MIGKFRVFSFTALSGVVLSIFLTTLEAGADLRPPPARTGTRVWAPMCRKDSPARMISSVPREPAAYLPRAYELREELAVLDQRARGFQQDILDFRKTEERFRQVLRDYRRLYPQDPSEAEKKVESLYRTLHPAYRFFGTTLRPDAQGCRHLIHEMESRFLNGPVSQMPETEDADLAKRMVEKLCRLPAGS